MKPWLGLCAVASALACGHAADPLDEFHAGEHRCLATFNSALHRQRANQIDERELAATIDRDVLPPWRDMRARVEAARLPARIDQPMRKYLADRQTAWEAFSAALHAPSDADARAHYDTYHAVDAAADADARALAPALR